MTNTNTHTKTKTKTKFSKDPTYGTFLKSRGFKDIKYDNMSTDQTRPDQTRPDIEGFNRGPNSRTFVLVVFKIMFQEEVDCTEVDYTSELSDKGKGCMQ